MACRQGAIEYDHIILARKARSEATDRDFPKVWIDGPRRHETDLAPPLGFEGLHVIGRALPVRLSRKPEQPVDALRVAIDVVGVVRSNPAGMSLQIDDVNRLATRPGHLCQTRNRIRNTVVMLERSAADDQVEGPPLGKARDVEIPPHRVAELAVADGRGNGPSPLPI